MPFIMKALAVSFGILVLSIDVIRPVGAQGSTQEKGFWQIETDIRDQPSLQFRRGDKVVFDIGVGRAIGLWIAYPGLPRPDGKATIAIQTTSKTWILKGELTNDHTFDRDDQRVTYFLQWDMGLSRPKPEFNKLTQIYNAFIISLLVSKRVVIMTNAGTVILPKVDVKNARKQMLI